MIDYNQIFSKFNISPADKEMYAKILASKAQEKEFKIIDHFMKVYVYKMNARFQKVIESVLLTSITETLTQKEITAEIVGFQSASTYYTKILQTNFNEVSDMLVESMIDKYQIKNAQLAKAIRQEVYQEFNTFINGTMSMTEQDVLKYVRTLQREMLQRNMKLDVLKQSGVLDNVIEKEKKLFKENMLNKYPQLKKMLNDGEVLKSRPWIDANGELKYRTFTLDEYTEMSVQQTILNADRTITAASATQNNERVLEYYLRDNRVLKTYPNEVCQSIIKKKIKGKAILALDIQAAKVLGILTVDEAKAKGAMNISHHCRHSVRRIEDKDYLNMIDKLLYASSVASDFARRESHELNIE